jgi:hypothetical protein
MSVISFGHDIGVTSQISFLLSIVSITAQDWEQEP